MIAKKRPKSGQKEAKTGNRDLTRTEWSSSLAMLVPCLPPVSGRGLWWSSLLYVSSLVSYSISPVSFTPSASQQISMGSKWDNFALTEKIGPPCMDEQVSYWAHLHNSKIAKVIQLPAFGRFLASFWPLFGLFLATFRITPELGEWRLCTQRWPSSPPPRASFLHWTFSHNSPPSSAIEIEKYGD